MITEDYSMSLIELDNVSFAYDIEEPYVLKDLSLEMKAGECLVIKGDNGSGKSTLFRILNGLSFPQKGRYFFDGTQITEKYLNNNTNAKLFHKRIGYLFQNPDTMLFNGRTYDEVAFGPRQMGLSDEEVDRRTRDCMELFSISELAGKAPYHLSGGQKKRVALAAVMALNPEVLILDEPFAGLDKKTQYFLADFLSEMKADKKTLLIATHEDTLTEALADQVVYLCGNGIGKPC
jgi:cobalt/nickel transport system ATP-binding protein